MPYQALYRQWRPKDFSHMVGQEAIVGTLRNQIASGRVAHAYLFCGSRGTGKTSAAKIMAKAVNCEHPENGDPCGRCDTCVRIDREESMDIMEIDAASNNGVDNIRDLRENVTYPPQHGKYKVYIVDEVHMLSASAFNALLKTLEEPPEHVIFILATTEPQKLPATILSRCQRYDFGRIPAAQIASRLREAADKAGAKSTDEALMMISRAAEGGMRDALSILDMCLGYGTEVNGALVREVLGTGDLAFMFRFSDALLERDAAALLGSIDELMRGGREAGVFAREVSAHIRALLMALCCPEAMGKVLELPDEDVGDYVEHAKRFTVTRLMEILDLFMALENGMRYASSPRVALEATGLKCCLRTTAPDEQALNDRISELQSAVDELKKRPDGGVSAAPRKTAAPDEQALNDRMTELQNAVDELKKRLDEGASAAPADKAARAAAKTGAAQSKPEAGGPAEKATPAAADGIAAKAETADNVSAGAAAALSKPPAEVWGNAVVKLRKTEPSVVGMLQLGKLLGAKGNVFRWQANKGFDAIAASLNVRKQKIIDALTEAAGTACGFEASAIPKEKEAAAQAASDEEYLQSLYDVFGHQAVTVKD